MDIWKLIWIVVLLAGMAGFAYISLKVAIRGFSETRSLLKEMTETQPDKPALQRLPARAGTKQV
jgi:hypothetical protein